jgi:uncharacterized repeat protein (TIGR01451 family)
MLAVVMVMMVSAAAAVAGPVWRIDTVANTTAVPGGTLQYFVQLTNIGDAPMDGSEIDLVVTLPAGLTGVSASDPTLTCTAGDGVSTIVGASVIKCVSTDQFPAKRQISPQITVAVDPGALGTLTSSFEVSGGGGGDAQTVDPTQISAVPPAFGVDAFDGQVNEDASGMPFTQAGGHPFDATTEIDFNTLTNPNPQIGDLWPVEPTKDVLVDLPPGFIGNPTVSARCTASQLANSASIEALPLCPPDSQVGTTLVRLNGFGPQNVVGPLPVFNVVPPPNVAARFGFNISGTVVTLDGALRSGSDYGLSVDARNISEGLPIAGTSLTFWGVPSDPRHDSDRACPGHDAPASGGPTCPSGATPAAFLRNPTSCVAPADSGVSDGLATDVHIDSYENPGRLIADGSADLSDPNWKNARFVSHLPPSYPSAPSDWGPHQLPTGCDNEPFDPKLIAAPVPSAKAGQPAGFAFDVSLPQSDEPSAIGEADLKKAVVTLPVGLRISPASADGLQGCSSSQIGLVGTNFPAPNPIHFTTADPTCPDASKVGSLTITTPLLDKPLTGSIYLAIPNDNPFNSLVAIYLVAKGSGLIVKLPGEVSLDPATGQITTTFDNQPQTPVSDVHLEFGGGPFAPLVLPKQCGMYTTHAEFTSWSGKTASSDPSFSNSSDGNGAPCPGPQFSPSLFAGTANPEAGVFTPFGLQLQRSDEDQEFGSLRSLSLPPGLLADVGSVSVRCSEVQARAAACPSGSHIGTVLTGAGAGPDPFYVPGDVYLMGGFSSGPFKGDPFGLAVVVHAQAGPFDLGYVVVEAGIQVHDDGSISSQTEPFPTILQGIPLQLKDIRLNLDRPDFMLNPTSCNEMAVAGTAVSTAGQTADLSSRFQVGDCASLAFRPSFSVSTAGKTSKANGASLHVHVATHEGPNGGEANIAKVDVRLPVVLPARLPTLQKACTAAQFAVNPAGCPEGSFVGTAVAHSPILASPLSGPAILVSHGGLAFPDLVLVLQGEGVRINLTGHTQIKNGVTFSRFETVPDAPVTSFDLTLPQGPHGVLTTDVPGRDLCATVRTVTVTKHVTRRVNGRARRVTVKAKQAVAAAPLLMPTTITAQNGVVIQQNTRIAVTGCVKAKAKRKAKRGRGVRR